MYVICSTPVTSIATVTLHKTGQTLQFQHIRYLIFRHMLAILHFNENLMREKRKAKDGTSHVNVVYPKYKFGEELVRQIAVPPTYGMYKVTLYSVIED